MEILIFLRLRQSQVNFREIENAHKIAINHLKGVFSEKIKKLRTDLINLSSLLELELDFSEEDVEFANREKLTNLINEIDDFVKY